jgi:hypothetical protein
VAQLHLVRADDPDFRAGEEAFGDEEKERARKGQPDIHA